MAKNNYDTDFIKYDDKKRQAGINNISKGYEELHSKYENYSEENKTTADILREKYNENPDSLNASQKLILGFANIEDERKAKEDNE